MRSFGQLLLSMWLLSGSQASHSQSPAAADRATRAEAVITPLAAADQFSGVVLVAVKGVPVFRRAYGLANREWTVANTPDTKFRIGSITKQFTAAAVLQLAEQGKLSIDAPLSKYYPAAPAAWSAVSIRHLLTHTSGIPSFTNIPHFFEQQARLDRTPEEIIQLTSDKPLEFAAGSRYSYDNSGYDILGYVIEKVSGERYADYLQHHIFDVLGMKSSGYDVSETLLPKRAAGYSFDGGRFINAHFISMTVPYAAGSLYTTVDDMLTWDQALYTDRILNADSRRAMFTDYGHSYGFGWVINRQNGHARIQHAGLVNGFVTRIDRYPDDERTIVVFSNEDSAGPAVAKICESLAEIYLDPR